MLGQFVNEPYTDFSVPENRRAQEAALQEISKKFDRQVPLFIGGKEITSERKLKSFNPSNKDQIVSTFHRAGKKEVDLAMEAALRAFEKWRWVAPKERALVLMRAANILRRRKMEVNAWMITEAGKSWIEAEADTSEAVDFLEFYAREMIRWSEIKGVTPFPREYPELNYIPLGVTAVIPPWNFPMAILTGMTVAAIVTGNTVLLKPASDSPAIGYLLVEIMREAGLPDGVLNFIPGSGGEIGDYLVEHPKTRLICFTGSKEVGLRIIELAAKTSPGQIWVKRVIAEMGGKDTIVVDHETDLDDAARNIVASAFGYQGQKCSACSRAIIVQSVYEKMIKKIAALTEQLTVGPTENPENYMGPVINQASQEKILSYIEIGKKEGKLVSGGEKAPGNGYFLKPTVFRDIQPGARLDQEEIFGPLLAVIKAKDFDQAIQIANSTEYGLTGSVYTRNRYKIETAKKLFYVGNLYINRKCTGAMVGAHPFGGFNMSGTDSKAGGMDYLGLFMQAKSISEKIG
ncbi:MAG TPA: L-glutamate gamma-semialdehyde dehydrogenase [bacterium]|jgi:1-pyrroline-5-carboxylate dehydrogenase|nr:L-glutamate gamma-semialdehyde dehydrogenase [bacterium]HNT66871.1 L-glutamate gamma-semialdehyde dehydrogenase [bacterium]HOX86453.1 L-glutamate gamma-semialdehyde dehydrogenase [bacterium]HPG47331.1 L-glutamate gamma-semialdehyde dehydrogenase [bacterium]HPM99658.1 L-glutamate gamma-semialdehyde dehydrogenase [bacterium]